MRGSISLIHINQIRYLLYRKTETIRPAPVRGRNARRLSLVLTVISPLKPCGNFMGQRFRTYKVYKYSITAYLCVSYDSHIEKKIFPYAAIAGSLCNRDVECLLRGTE